MSNWCPSSHLPRIAKIEHKYFSNCLYTTKFIYVTLLCVLFYGISVFGIQKANKKEDNSGRITRLSCLIARIFEFISDNCLFPTLEVFPEFFESYYVVLRILKSSEEFWCSKNLWTEKWTTTPSAVSAVKETEQRPQTYRFLDGD